MYYFDSILSLFAIAVEKRQEINRENKKKKKNEKTKLNKANNSWMCTNNFS